MATELHRAMDVRDANRLAVELGCSVSIKRCTGETLYRHPSMRNRLFNGRKKTVPPPVVTWLRKLRAKRSGLQPEADGS